MFHNVESIHLAAKDNHPTEQCVFFSNWKYCLYSSLVYLSRENQIFLVCLEQMRLCFKVSNFGQEEQSYFFITERVFFQCLQQKKLFHQGGHRVRPDTNMRITPTQCFILTHHSGQNSSRPNSCVFVYLTCLNLLQNHSHMHHY